MKKLLRIKLPKSSGIYQIQSIINGKCYIGSATDLKVRRNLHLKHLKLSLHGNRHLQNHVNKYGLDDLEFSVLEFCSKEKLLEKEQWKNPEFRRRRSKKYKKLSLIG